MTFYRVSVWVSTRSTGLFCLFCSSFLYDSLGCFLALELCLCCFSGLMGFLEFAGFCLLNDIESNHVLLSFDIDLNFVET